MRSSPKGDLADVIACLLPLGLSGEAIRPEERLLGAGLYSLRALYTQAAIRCKESAINCHENMPRRPQARSLSRDSHHNSVNSATYSLTVCSLTARFAVSSAYSINLRSLIACLLEKKPHDRPSMDEITRMPFMQEALQAVEHLTANAQPPKLPKQLQAKGNKSGAASSPIPDRSHGKLPSILAAETCEQPMLGPLIRISYCA